MRLLVEVELEGTTVRDVQEMIHLWDALECGLKKYAISPVNVKAMDVLEVILSGNWNKEMNVLRDEMADA